LGYLPVIVFLQDGFHDGEEIIFVSKRHTVVLLCYLKSLGLKKLLNAEHSCNIGGEFPWVMTMARNRNLAEGETTLSSH